MRIRPGLWAGVLLTAFALLAFTAVYTSPVSPGVEPGHSLSTVNPPKQRHLSIKEIVWARPELNHLEMACSERGEVVPPVAQPRALARSLGRYFNLPPPKA